MAYTESGYSILLFLEVCYEVDRALCGVDTDALAAVQKWHQPADMTAFKYILSSEMFSWWKTEFCELGNEIQSQNSNWVSVRMRHRDIGMALSNMRVVMEGRYDGVDGVDEFEGDDIASRIWGPSYYERLELPRGLSPAIFNRFGLLQSSWKVMLEQFNSSEPQSHLGRPMSLDGNSVVIDAGGCVLANKKRWARLLTLLQGSDGEYPTQRHQMQSLHVMHPSQFHLY